MKLEELLKVRLEKEQQLSQEDCDKLGLYGDEYCQFEDEEDEDDW